MNLLELKKACDENLTVINSSNEEVKLLFVSDKSILVAKLDSSKLEYKVKRNENYVSEWKLKPVTKKYYLWKYKVNQKSSLAITDAFYDDEKISTSGHGYTQLKEAFYKEKIESTMHEE